MRTMKICTDFCFAALCTEIIDLFIKTSLKHASGQGYEAGKLDTNEKLVTWLIDELVTFKEGKEILSKMFTNFRNNIE